MRRSKEEAAETRRRIVKTAADEFRRHGIDGIGLSDLMEAAGLTHGGFYKHFSSKTQLVAEACGLALDSVADAMAAVATGRPPGQGLQAVVATYLSETHRDHPSQGCAIAALGSEIARADAATRAAATEGVRRLIDVIAGELDDTPVDAAKRRAAVMVSTMVGALLVSRIVDDPVLSGAVLADTKDHVLRSEPPSATTPGR